MKRLILCMGFSSCFLPLLAWGEMECSTQIVTLGDSEAKVLSACGYPGQQVSVFNGGNPTDVRTLPANMYAQVNANYIDTWTYNFGSQRLQYTLTFQNGKLMTIETGEYGYPMH
jgi:hypothetical protein